MLTLIGYCQPSYAACFYKTARADSSETFGADESHISLSPLVGCVILIVHECILPAKFVVFLSSRRHDVIQQFIILYKINHKHMYSVFNGSFVKSMFVIFSTSLLLSVSFWFQTEVLFPCHKVLVKIRLN